MKVYKYTFYFIPLLLCFFQYDLFAQTPNWIWARNTKSTGEDYISKTVTDKFGNIYIGGSFNSDSLKFDSFILRNSSRNNMFLVKLNPTGGVVWTQSVPKAFFKDMCIDSLGNIYTTGIFMATTITLGEINITSNDSTLDTFIAKFDTEGKALWAKLISDSQNAHLVATNIAVDNLQNIAIAGAFWGGPVVFVGDTLFPTSPTYDAIFIAKCNAEGVVEWAYSPKEGSTNDDYPNNINFDSQSNIYISSYYSSPTLIFENDTLRSVSRDTVNSFFVKYNSSGKVLWTKSAGNIFPSYNNPEFTVDLHDNTTIILTSRNPIIIFGKDTLFNPGRSSIINKFNSFGKLLFSVPVSKSYNVTAKEIQTDYNGNTYTIGNFFGDSAAIGNTTIYNSGDRKNLELFISKYNEMGEMIWVKSFGGFGTEYCSSFTTDQYGNLIIAGTFQPPSIRFDNIILNSNIDHDDLFIAKLGTNPTSVQDEVITQDNINIFPNPAKSTFHISGLEAGNCNITIYSLTGEKIYESLLKDSQTIDLSGKAKGTYIYQLQKEGEVLKTGKLIVE
ncbi:MAG: T9SS type A sorting domain-containing protein [Bacteroidota bacterium]